MAVFVDQFDALLYDLDGVVFVGRRPIVPSVSAINELQSRAIPRAFITNNASRPPSAVVDHLAAVGVDAVPGEVLTSAQVTVRLLKDLIEPRSVVLVVGGEGIVEALLEAGFVPTRVAAEAPVAVVQGFDPAVDWNQLAQAATAIRNGALWLATNLDLTIPLEDGPAPGNGALVAAVAQAAGTQPSQSVGKPEPIMVTQAAEQLGASRPLVVGDRPDTDIAAARAATVASVLVATGVADADMAFELEPEERPDWVLRDVSGLLGDAFVVDSAEGVSASQDWVIGSRDDEIHVQSRGRDAAMGVNVALDAIWRNRDQALPELIGSRHLVQSLWSEMLDS